VVLKALPVGPKLGEAVLVDVLDTGSSQPAVPRSCLSGVSHASGTAGDLAALLHALELAAAVALRLAHHVVIVVVLAPRADEEGGAEEGRRAGSKLLDLGDVVGQRGRVDEGLLIEPAGISSRISLCGVRSLRTWAGATTWWRWVPMADRVLRRAAGRHS
jgi:hypothetical protein